ncbi:phosphoglycolate phosphatase [Falsirhodobacter halotolerans]|uniref:phosphoglycolate phosphatase n=1 Tax=Falsirhodobacter halotolerans TaxID=1146892 RepID=UPI001FD22818|nr:phosphoglycolate phosphatase [Falsirhodobacter halotolerans]MCJ8139908.1 phosphoglycolate phosphatase [Falsirhodobacter halotolerans]
MTYRRIIFDLDGTLIDTLPEIHDAASALLRDNGLPPLAPSIVRGFIGHGVEALVHRIADHVGGPDDRTPWIEGFGAHYAKVNGQLAKPFGGVVQMLADLSATAAMAVCTNKPEALAREVLEAMNLGPFQTIVGGDSLGVRKPDPAPLRLAASRLGEGPVLYVGDSEVDAETAEAAGIDFALFTGGYRKKAAEDLPHRFVFDDFADLTRLIGA